MRRFSAFLLAVFLVSCLCLPAFAGTQINPMTGLPDRVGSTSGADNLGNHTATQDLDMGGNDIVGDAGSGLAVDGNADTTTDIQVDSSGNVGIGDTTPSYKLDVNGTSRFVGLASFDGGMTTGTQTDPSAILNVSTAGDVDYWYGVSSDNDGVADVSDVIQVGTGATPFSSRLFQFNPYGSIEIGDGTNAAIDIQFLTSATTYDPRIRVLTGGTGRGYVYIDGVGAGTNGGSYASFFVKSVMSDGNNGDVKAAIWGDQEYNADNANGPGVGLVGKLTMTNTSGSSGVGYGVYGFGAKNTSGTMSSFHGGFFDPATISSGSVTYNYALGLSGRSHSLPDEDTVADSGDGNPAAATLNPSSKYVEMTCSDSDGCDITMGEAGVLEGTPVKIVNVSANACNFADTSGVSELAGAFAMGQYDTLVLEYIGDRWVEITRSDN